MRLKSMHFHSFNGLDELLLPRQRQTMNIMLLYCLFLLVGSLLLSSLCSHDTVPLYVFLLKCSQTTVSKLYRGFYLVMSTYSVFLPLSLPPLLFAEINLLCYYFWKSFYIIGQHIRMHFVLSACFYWIVKNCCVDNILHLFELLALTGCSKTFCRCKECW